jgi:hypothetical protein
VRNGGLFFSAVQALIITLAFGVAFLFFLLHYVPGARETVSSRCLAPPVSFFFFGILASAIALMLTISFWAMQKGGFIRVQMGHTSFIIEEPLVRNGVHLFWKEALPRHPLPQEIYIAQQKIEVIAPEMEEESLAEIESRLEDYFSKHFGYTGRFFLTLTKK